MSWSDAWIGIPWRDHGRERTGCDCWGLVRLVLRDECGIDLPTYTDAYASADEIAEIDAAIRGEAAHGDWRPIGVDDAQPYDVLVFRRGVASSHVAVVVDRRHMLHMIEMGQSCIADWRAQPWGRRLVGFWRHVDRSHERAT